MASQEGQLAPSDLCFGTDSRLEGHYQVITIQGEYNATGHLSAFRVESLLATRRCHVGYFELSVEDILNEEARTEALRMFVDDNDLVRYQLVPELSTFLALIPPERLQGPHSLWNTEAW